ncbi:MAG: hypothetical protein HZR80_04225 [Candidatus Heimdallarchaeota archaeon]
MTSESKLSPEQRVKITCDLSNTALAIFLSSLKTRFSDLSPDERIDYLKKLVRDRERNRRL